MCLTFKVSYLVVDEMHQEHPELIKDAYWDDVDFELPYTPATENLKSQAPFLGSAMDIKWGIHKFILLDHSHQLNS